MNDTDTRAYRYISWSFEGRDGGVVPVVGEAGRGGAVDAARVVG